jgi:hypothetical protein
MRNRYAKVEGHSNIVRDLKTNAIVNTDTVELQNYLSLKERKNREKEQIKLIQTDIEYLKNSIEEIKFLLKNQNNDS